MALFFNIRQRKILTWEQMLKTSIVRTYGKEQFQLFSYRDGNLITRVILEAEGIIPAEQEQVPVTLGAVTTWRKILYLVKALEMMTCLLKLAVDQLLLRLSLKVEGKSNLAVDPEVGTKSQPAQIDLGHNKAQNGHHHQQTQSTTSTPLIAKEIEESLAWTNWGMWLRGLLYIPLNLLDGIVRCVTSPWNWVVRPIVNYCLDNWPGSGKGKAKVAFMFLLGLGIAAVVAASVFTGGLLPLTFMASWALSVLIPTLVATLIASMVVAHRICTGVPEAWYDLVWSIKGQGGYDSKNSILSGANPDERTRQYMQSEFLSYEYFNTSLDGELFTVGTHTDDDEEEHAKPKSTDTGTHGGYGSTSTTSTIQHGKNRHLATTVQSNGKMTVTSSDGTVFLDDEATFGDSSSQQLGK